MGSAEMSRVCIITHCRNETKLLEGLQDIGLLQITDSSKKLLDADWAQVLKAHEPPEVKVVEERLEKARFLLEFLGRFQKKKNPVLEGLAGIRQVVLAGRENYEETAREALRRLEPAYKHCKSLEGRLKAEESELKKLLELKGQIRPIAHVGLSLEEFGESQKSVVLLGSITKNHLKSFEECGHLYIRRLEERKSDFLVAVAYLKEMETEALAQIDKHHFTRIFIPPLKGHMGTPNDILERLDAKIGNARARRLEVVKEIDKSGAKWERGLKFAHDCLLAEKGRLAGLGFSGRTESSIVVEGWAKRADLGRIEKRVLESCGSAAVFLSREPAQGEDVPIVLENRSAAPFEIVTRTYGLPNYREIDPTPLLAPSFLVFFGLALTDAGYGIALMLMSLLLMRRLGNMGGLLLVLLYGGAATVFFGALIGGWFGTAAMSPLWFDSVKEPILFMELALVIGMVHISIGILVKMYAHARRGRYLDALLDEGVWLWVLGGIAAILAGQLYGNAILENRGYWIAGTGMVMAVLYQGREHKNPLKRLLFGLVSLYNLVGFTGDVLSYTRLLALGIATGIIALAVNSIAGMAYGAGGLGLAVSAVIFVVGHGFNIVINTLGAYIHASRLHYVEFFSKFFEGGGKKFEPLRRQGVYTEVVDA